MLSFTCPINSGSLKTIKWASNTCASSSPKFFNAVSLINSTSLIDAANASSKRETSFSESSTVTFVTVKSGSVKVYTLAIAMPSLAAIPCNVGFILFS